MTGGARDELELFGYVKGMYAGLCLPSFVSPRSALKFDLKIFQHHWLLCLSLQNLHQSHPWIKDIAVKENSKCKQKILREGIMKQLILLQTELWIDAGLLAWPGLVYTCVGLRRLALNWSRSNLYTSQPKCTQGLAKRSRKHTQVFNLRVHSSPFGQGFIENCREFRNKSMIR